MMQVRTSSACPRAGAVFARQYCTISPRPSFNYVTGSHQSSVSDNHFPNYYRCLSHRYHPNHRISVRFASTSPPTAATTAAATSSSSQSTTRSSTIPPILFVTGGPGAGKGTQCGLLVRRHPADVRGEDGEGQLPSSSAASSSVAAAAPLSTAKSLDASLMQRFATWLRSVLGRGDAETTSSATNSPSSSSLPNRFRINGREIGVVHISVGAVLRRAVDTASSSSSSEIENSDSSGISAADRALIVKTLSSGGILTANLTVKLLKQEILRVAREQKQINPKLHLVALIDGFPRTLANVHAFEREVGTVDSVLMMECVNDRMIERLSKRGRSDDQPDIISRRIDGFYRDTMPVVEWFRGKVQQVQSNSASPLSIFSPEQVEPYLFVVDGNPPIDVVAKEIEKVFLQFVTMRVK